MKKYIWLLLLCGSLSAQTYLNPYRDAYKLRVSKGYDSTATTVILSTGQGAYLPTSNFDLVWYNASAYFHPFDDASNDEHFEWIHVGTRSGDTLKSVLRGQMRTTKSNHNIRGYTYKVIPVISENMWLKVDTVLVNAGAYQSPTLTEIQDTMNTGSVTMSSVWSFADTAKFNSAVYMATGTGTIIYLNGSSIITALGIPTSARILGGSSGSIPKFYYLVGAGGAAITVSNDTIYITAGGGGTGDSITAIQSPGGTIAVTNPNGPTVSIDVAVGGLDSSRFGLGSVTNSKLKDGSVTTGKFHADAVAPSATYATTAGGAPPTGSATGGVIIGTFPNSLTIDASKITGTMILNGTIGTADLSSTCKSPLAGYADSIFNQSSLLASKLDLTRRAKFSLSGQSVFYDSLRIIAGTYMSIIQSGNTLTFNSTGGSGGVGPYTGLGTSFWADDSTFILGQGVISKNGYFSMFDNNGVLIGSDYTPQILVDSLAAVRATAADASNLTTGTINPDRISTTGTDSLDGVYTRRGEWKLISQIYGGGTGMDIIDTNSFTTTAQYDTIVNPNFKLGDRFTVDAFVLGVTAPTANDNLAYYVKDESLFVMRPANGTSDLKYSYGRYYVGGGSPPEWSLTDYDDDSLRLVLWLDVSKETGKSNGQNLTQLTDWSTNAANLTSHNVFYTTGGNNGLPYYKFTGLKDSSNAYTTDADILNIINAASGGYARDSFYVLAVMTVDTMKNPIAASRYYNIASWYNQTNPNHEFDLTWWWSNTQQATWLYNYVKGYNVANAKDSAVAFGYNFSDADSILFLDTAAVNSDSSNIVEWTWCSRDDSVKTFFNNSIRKGATKCYQDTFAVSQFTVGALRSTVPVYSAPMRLYALYVWKGIPNDAILKEIRYNTDTKFKTAYVHYW